MSRRATKLLYIGIVIVLALMITGCIDPQRFNKEPRRDWCGDVGKPAEQCR